MIQGILFSSFSPRGHQLVFSWPSHSYLGFDQHFLSDILSPKIALCDKPFHLQVDQVYFIGHPTQLHADRVGTGLKFSRMCQDRLKPESDPNPYQLTMFNMVLALDSNQVEDDDIEMIYQQIIIKTTAALKYEQLRYGYVRKEIELVLGLKEDCGLQEDLTTKILQQSTLARSLVSIFNALQGEGRHIQINDSISISLQTDFKKMKQLTMVSEDDLYGFPMFRPYHALLLLFDPEEIISALPPGASPLMVELIQIVTPTQCFEELQNTLNCSLAQLYKLAAHLFVWNKARVIDAISIRNIYTISPKFDLTRLETLTNQFSVRFPTMELSKLLQELSSPRPYSTIIGSKENRNLYLEIITFLIRHHIVVQLHMYMYLLVPELVCEKVRKTFPEKSLQGPLIIANPSKPSFFEKECIRLIAKAHPDQVASMFLR